MPFLRPEPHKLPGFFMERHMGTKKKGGKKY